MQDWVWLIIIVAIVLVVWWLITRSAKAEPPYIEAQHEAEQPPIETAKAARVELEAPKAVAAAPAQPDDLTRLEGIGPKIASLLKNAGIITFAKLAETNAGRLREILDKAGLRFTDPGTWAEQAKLAASGKWEELDKLTAKLKGGRRV